MNWSSGFNIIVPDKKKLDVEAAKKKLRSWMKPEMNSYYQYFNWGYKHMKPMIYAEEYLEQVAGQVYDYKFFMCGGEMEFLFIATDRHGDHTLTYTFFDKNLEHIPCTYGGKKNASPLPEMPKNIDKMIELAKKLAKPFPFVRVDFYEVGDRVYLGEMTFYSGGGVLAFEPEEWDLRLGEKIHFPGRKIVDHESAAFLCEAKIRQVGYKMKENVKALIKKFVRKEAHEGQKYLSVLGVIRLPYKTHAESSASGTRRYFTLQGVEICYKKMNKSGSDSMQLTYRPCTPLENYMLEGKITPQMQRIHAEQKAYAQMGYFPNLRNPRSLNEKIIWLALNYKNPHIAVAADKGKAKQWLAERIGWEYLIPTIGVYEDVNDIDFSALPEKFVAKLNDGWGGDEVMIVRSKSDLDIDRTKAVLSSWLYPWKNYYYQNMCMTDEKMEKPTIVIEEYVQQGSTGALDDYKIYCCNGEPRFALVVTGRGTNHQERSFVDMDWNILPFARTGKAVAEHVDKPQNLDKMLELCRTLCKDFPFVRVDFYEANGRIYVGEMTFTPGMFLKFSSREWDFKLGEYLELPME